MSDSIKRMCVRQRDCCYCPLGRAAQDKVLDCKQYIDRFPLRAEWIAKKWIENNGGNRRCP